VLLIRANNIMAAPCAVQLFTPSPGAQQVVEYCLDVHGGDCSKPTAGITWSTEISSTASNFFIDVCFKYAYGIFSMKIYSTGEVARELGIHKTTLLRWLYSGKLKEPRRIEQPGVDYRLWSEKDLERVRRYKEETYCKGRGRKAQSK
jgi:hypothetical protein